MVGAVPASGVAFMPRLDEAALLAEADNPQAAGARCPELMAACQHFEAVFLGQLMRVMRQGESKDTLFGGGLAEGIYRELLDDQLASEMATTGSTGIAAMLYERLEATALAQAREGHGTDTVSGGSMEATDEATTRRTTP